MWLPRVPPGFETREAKSPGGSAGVLERLADLAYQEGGAVGVNECGVLELKRSERATFAP